MLVGSGAQQFALEQGFTLGKKAGDRVKLASVTRADLFRADKGAEE